MGFFLSAQICIAFSMWNMQVAFCVEYALEVYPGPILAHNITGVSTRSTYYLG
jgi:hypothetical protein